MRSDQEDEFRQYVVTRTERLRRFAYLCCGDWHRAEDVVQTALLRLYRAWNRASRRSVDGYTRRIIVNLLIDEYRLVWFRRVHVSDRLPDRAPPDTGGGSEQRMVLTEALMRLPKRQRAAVVLRFWEDLSIEQTAKVMGCSNGSVKNLTMRGLATLRGLLAEEDLVHIQGVAT
ncbi:SigE family RNA polymerase sigma factor [Phytomonospora endophytica]|uniref:RNA polymerase sigma-70 factor (Sigma-E family) n=1 Tax=Phytomonospora endophytica TaxID=714109 RepID=A0A841FS34_9ACTN|nr:SigE family RNA polymerase sigma factor [Phytomonospora endophytica]MBB6036362.1 RNA polymerase sigma-70 factor (sigma-E family) [Phytomonospora endophytica]GIG67268.1 RNA polymerase sigma24 factor [Phytomonospora endophytica]